MRLFVVMAIVLIALGIVSVARETIASVGSKMSAGQAATSPAPIMGVLAIAGGVAFLVASREARMSQNERPHA